MAKFRYMHEFVSSVREHNDINERDPTMVALTDDEMEFLRWMKRDEAISAFAKSHKEDEILASEVYEDTVKFKYIHPHNPHLPHQDKYLQVTPDGRHFLKRAWKFKAGMWREWANDNHNLATLGISFVSGIIIGIVGVIIAIISLSKP